MASFSVANARAHFPRLLKAVENGERVTITRRGRTVAVMISAEESARLEPASGFLAAWNRWHATTTPEDVSEPFFEELRDRSPGRDVDL